MCHFRKRWNREWFFLWYEQRKSRALLRRRKSTPKIPCCRPWKQQATKEFEKDTEKKGLGTPATRAAILEKLVSSGYVQRKGKQMIPTEDGVAAIRNIPDYLKSASMTAEWENDLLRMERGEIKPHDFMQGIHGLLDKMLADLRQIPTVAAAPYHNKVSVGSCPVCGNPVHESKLSFCCADRSCKFALWKESRYLSNMRKTLDKKMAVDLLKKGRTHVKDFYSAKKDKTFAADLVMRVEDGPRTVQSGISQNTDENENVKEV